MGPREALLIIADSEANADLYWATRFFVPDPIIFLEYRGKKILVASDLEYSRARREATVDEVLPLSRYSRNGEPLVGLLRERRIRRLVVPASFPLRQAERLKKKGFRVTVGPDPFFFSRALKSAREKKEIIRSLRATENAIRLACSTLRKARIRRDRIVSKGRTLTSEGLRRRIELCLMEQGFLARHTIVACGAQAADPHCAGSGPLRPNLPIVMDVFPRSAASGYHGDITRTVVKGRASDAVRRMHRAVRAGQEAAFARIRHGVDAAVVHREVVRAMETAGFKTETVNGRPQGFIHSTGHGLGLEIHESPRISRLSERLRKGNVVTVEPGLYYERWGGVRIEDVVYVTKRGCELLTRLPRGLEIP